MNGASGCSVPAATGGNVFHSWRHGWARRVARFAPVYGTMALSSSGMARCSYRRHSARFYSFLYAQWILRHLTCYSSTCCLIHRAIKLNRACLTRKKIPGSTKGKHLGNIYLLPSWKWVPLWIQHTMDDYFVYIFLDYHPTRVLTLAYLPFVLCTTVVFTYHDAKINTRARTLVGYSLFLLRSLGLITEEVVLQPLLVCVPLLQYFASQKVMLKGQWPGICP
ncbi:uncharacterized protein LOC101779277 isoform X2 [Setaria italica]|uniref:uncharacterized protein LOC101779277 isoform X2 n=1 Tax=Setaria italica TaxID=4555 RepID=UPI000646D1B5|nr:uncharacterized protein LOC101779277 isoform X2 [Setaria italica]XP_034582053.1 uncharacterized protein LOC117845202 isoform X2 [Setaria viridis]